MEYIKGYNMKQKILIVNKFLYPRGGDCICSLNLRNLLETNGHEVCFFAMDYSENIQFPESKYFADEVSFTKRDVKSKISAFKRLIWGTGIKKKLEDLIDIFKPDIVHLNNIHSYLSPIIAKLAYDKNIKVIWTLHDYKLICPTYSCLYNGQVCEACFSNKSQVLFRKCMKKSIIASALAFGEAIQWNQKKLSQWVDTFICPSQFMAEKMLQAGYPVEKLKVVCNFIADEKIDLIHSINTDIRNAYCYIGRLSEEKGLETLLAVAATLPYNLYIAGEGPLKNNLCEKYSSANNIHFMGQLNYHEIIALLRQVCFSVIPSIWYENNPLSVIESLCCGTPVLGSRIGGIPELLTDDYSQLFVANNPQDLEEKIHLMFNKCGKINNYELSNISISRFSSEVHYSKLIDIYNNYNFYICNSKSKTQDD